MKTIQITLTLVLLVWASILNAQKFEGKIAFKTEFTELPAEMESMKSMMEMNITTYVKGNLSRTETKGMMTPEIINIMDLDKKLMTTLILIYLFKAILKHLPLKTQSKINQISYLMRTISPMSLWILLRI
jgi:hypothetical protein